MYHGGFDYFANIFGQSFLSNRLADLREIWRVGRGDSGCYTILNELENDRVNGCNSTPTFVLITTVATGIFESVWGRNLTVGIWMHSANTINLVFDRSAADSGSGIKGH